MATGEIIGKVNIPLSKSSFYEGLSTDTADTNVDNINKTISVDVKIDKVTEELDERVTRIEDGMLVYNYFYYDDSEKILFSLENTTYVLREFSSKGVLSDNLDDCKVIFNSDDIVDLGQNHLCTADEQITLYQTGLESEIRTQRYGYDNIDIINQVVNRYCYVISLPDLLKSFTSQQWSWSGTGTANGRLTINHVLLESIGIFTENGIVPKYTKDIGLIYKGISSTNFAIDNLKSIEGITNKATAIKTLTNGDYDDVYIVFKRIEPVQESFSTYNLNFITHELICDGVQEVGIQGFSGCILASYISLKDLVYNKEQVDEKFVNKVEFNGNEHIVKIGDSDKNEIEATLDIYNVTLKGLGYPKYACAKCVAPTSDSEDETPVEVPFRGDTLFINQIRNVDGTNQYGYFVISQGKEYWMSKESVSETKVIKHVVETFESSSFDGLRSGDIYVDEDSCMSAFVNQPNPTQKYLLSLNDDATADVEIWRKENDEWSCTDSYEILTSNSAIDISQLTSFETELHEGDILVYNGYVGKFEARPQYSGSLFISHREEWSSDNHTLDIYIDTGNLEVDFLSIPVIDVRVNGTVRNLLSSPLGGPTMYLVKKSIRDENPWDLVYTIEQSGGINDEICTDGIIEYQYTNGKGELHMQFVFYDISTVDQSSLSIDAETYYTGKPIIGGGPVNIHFVLQNGV